MCEEDNAHIQTDEADTAREAVAEGQAMVVFRRLHAAADGQDAGGRRRSWRTS